MRTKLQEIQISGSLAPKDDFDLSMYASKNRSLVDELDALRTRVKDVLGEDTWLDAPALTLKGINDAFNTTLTLHDLVVTGDAGVSGHLGVTGALDVAGAATFLSSVQALSLGVTGAATLHGSLTVDGHSSLAGVTAAAADFTGAVKVTGANLSVINGDLYIDKVAHGAKQLLFMNATNDGKVVSDSDMVWDQAVLVIKGGISASAHIYGAIVNATTHLQSPLVIGDDVQVNHLDATRIAYANNDHKLVGSDEFVFDAAGHKLVLGTASQKTGLEVKGAADIYGDVTVYGGNVSAVDGTFSGKLSVTSDVTIGGNLNVLGTTTAIATSNTTIKDAFVYLASGSGDVDSGIVISKDAGADLLLASLQGPNNVFIAASKEMAPDSNNASGAVLAQMKAAVWQIGAVGAAANSSMVGYLSGSEAGIKLHAVSDMVLSVGAEQVQLSKIDGVNNELTKFFTQYGAGTSIVGALNKASAGGNIKKGILAPAAAKVNKNTAISFSSVGALRGITELDYPDANLDVYLNGVLQTSTGEGTDDIVISGVSEFKFTEIDIYPDDVITVIIRNAEL